eukprot:3689166-Rhodomonas_salina.1
MPQLRHVQYWLWYSLGDVQYRPKICPRQSFSPAVWCSVPQIHSDMSSTAVRYGPYAITTGGCPRMQQRKEELITEVPSRLSPDALARQPTRSPIVLRAHLSPYVLTYHPIRPHLSSYVLAMPCPVPA